MSENKTDDEVAGDGAAERLADQTPDVKVRVPMVQKSDGTYYLDVTTKPDLKTLRDFVALAGRIMTHSQGLVRANAEGALTTSTDLAVLYGAIERPKPAAEPAAKPKPK